MTARNNGLDPFEQRIKDALDPYEVPYNSADWNGLERRMNGTEAFQWRKGMGLAAGILIGGLVVGGATWYLMSSNTPVATLPTGADTETMAPVHTPAAAPVMHEAPATEPVSTSSTVVAEQPATANTTPAEVNEPRTATLPKERTNAGTTSASPLPPTGPAHTGHSAASNTPAPKNNTASKTLFSTTATESCSGNSIAFKAENLPENGIYLWNFGDGGFSNESAPQHVFSKPGRYQVTLSMSTPGGGTIHNKPSSATITVYEVPKAAFNVMKQEYDGHIPSVHFENRTMGAAQYHWDFGDGGTSTIAHPDHIYKQKGTYKVELTVTNELGCEDKTIREVRIENDYNLDANGSFTPNGATNNTFMPNALRNLGVRFTLSVYDNDGALMYQTTDATKPWTGRTNNRGEFCPAGDYVWVAEIRESSHISETFTGKVRLDR